MKHSFLIFILAALALLVAPAFAQSQASPQSGTIVVMPFENESKAPGLEWMSEAFPEVLSDRLSAASMLMIRREDRLAAFDRLGVPAGIRPSRATLFRVAQELDADFVVFGQFTYDGQTLTGSAQLLDAQQLKLFPASTEHGPLLNVLDVQNALAWDMLHQLDPTLATSKDAFVAAAPAVRLDAFENYVRGITATNTAEGVRRLREAVRLNPSYVRAIFALGKTYFTARDYENSAAWFDRVPHEHALSTQAAFLQGLAYYYLGEFDKSDAAFSFLASRLPLTEVYNNLGVVAGRRGRHDAITYFQKAVQADPNDPDYRFNLAVTLEHQGDSAGAARQLRQALDLRPNDPEARALLDSLAAGQTPARPPLERIKRNYDEGNFRLLAREVEDAAEATLSQKDPATHAQAHVERGRQMLNEGFAAEAEKQFREAVVLNPANAAAHLGLAASLEVSDSTAARKEAATATQLAPSADAYLLLARLDLRDNNLQQAQEDLDRALALDPASAGAQAFKRELAAHSSAPANVKP